MLKCKNVSTREIQLKTQLTLYGTPGAAQTKTLILEITKPQVGGSVLEIYRYQYW